MIISSYSYENDFELLCLNCVIETQLFNGKVSKQQSCQDVIFNIQGIWCSDEGLFKAPQEQRKLFDQGSNRWFPCKMMMMIDSKRFFAACLSGAAAVNLHHQGEDAVKAEARVGVKEEQGRSLHFTVDHNNFLPCVTVEAVSGHGVTTVDYKPLWSRSFSCNQPREL